ncbi:MAG: VOC family protein [Saprospiraceae bacterium]
MRHIDHIVYSVLDFEKAIFDIERQSGVKPVIGGKHQLWGTKNALLHLGGECYLEILAKDEDNLEFTGEMWMGIDLISKPQITRWALKSNDVQNDSKILSQVDDHLGQISGGQRKTSSGDILSWKMILPLSHSEVDIIPFMTDWSESAYHPSVHLEEGCQLLSLTLYHPMPSKIQNILSDLGDNHEVIQAKEPVIKISIQGKKGIFEL